MEPTRKQDESYIFVHVYEKYIDSSYFNLL